MVEAARPDSGRTRAAGRADCADVRARRVAARLVGRDQPDSGADGGAIEVLTKMSDSVNSDLKWYTALSAQKNAHPRCPFATAGSCPRFYQSLALLGRAGSTSIEPEEDERLLKKWQKNDLWPKTREQETSILGSENESKLFNHFCPEVSYERFGYFASFLGRYADTLDSELAQERLSREGIPTEDWRWYWASVVSMHYTDCPLYSVLAHRAGIPLGSSGGSFSSAPKASEPAVRKGVTLVRVFLAAPSDIEKEIGIVSNVIQEWNNTHS